MFLENADDCIISNIIQRLKFIYIFGYAITYLSCHNTLIYIIHIDWLSIVQTQKFFNKASTKMNSKYDNLMIIRTNY